MQQHSSAKWVKNFVIPFFIAIVLMSCKSNEAKNTDDRARYVLPDSLLKHLVMRTVEKRPLVNILTLTGSVDFDQDHQVNIYPLVSGNVQDVKVQLGDYVAAGQVLATVKSSEMAGYSNSLLVAETNVTATKKQLDATNDLFKSGLSSQLDVTNAQVNYDQALSQLEMAKRILKINGNNTEGDYVIKSPLSGFIVQKNVTNNMSIRSDNGTNLFTISDLRTVWVQANVYESNINNIHFGDSVNITTLSYPNKIFKGKVDKLINVLDPTNKVMKVRIVLPNPGYLLKPQMFASVTVLTKETGSKMLSVPSDALIFDNSQYYVLVYKSPSDISIRTVVVSHATGDIAYIESGVEEGEKVIASDALLIYQQLNS